MQRVKGKEAMAGQTGSRALAMTFLVVTAMSISVPSTSQYCTCAVCRGAVAQRMSQPPVIMWRL